MVKKPTIESLAHPDQPIGFDSDGRARFKSNEIVKALLDFATKRGFGLNEISCRGYADADYVQLMQLIGYSVSGFSELSSVSDAAYERATKDGPSDD